jgi:hypothetical protein
MVTKKKKAATTKKTTKKKIKRGKGKTVGKFGETATTMKIMEGSGMMGSTGIKPVQNPTFHPAFN